MKTMQQHIFISFPALKVSVCDSARADADKNTNGLLDGGIFSFLLRI